MFEEQVKELKKVTEIYVGSEVCFFEGKNGRPVAYTNTGKVILCRHKVSLGYATVKSVEDKVNYFLVTADHIIKDVYSGIDYADFIAALPLHGYKIGFDLPFENKDFDGNPIQEHQIYGYNLDNNVVIVAETFTWEKGGRKGFNKIYVYCPQANVSHFTRSGLVASGGVNITVFNLAYCNRRKYGLLEWINRIMKDIKNPAWPINEYPSLWTYADNDTTDENGEWNLGERHLHKLFQAPESLQIFKGCTFLKKIKEAEL